MLRLPHLLRPGLLFPWAQGDREMYNYCGAGSQTPESTDPRAFRKYTKSPVRLVLDFTLLLVTRMTGSSIVFR